MRRGPETACRGSPTRKFRHRRPERAAGRPIHSDQETDATKTTPDQNKILVLEAFDTLFNKRDYAAAERFWSARYIQHSAHIGPGREGLFDPIRLPTVGLGSRKKRLRES
jgi:hypothetical protein